MFVRSDALNDYKKSLTFAHDEREIFANSGNVKKAKDHDNIIKQISNDITILENGINEIKNELNVKERIKITKTKQQQVNSSPINFLNVPKNCELIRLCLIRPLQHLLKIIPKCYYQNHHQKHKIVHKNY